MQFTRHPLRRRAWLGWALATVLLSSCGGGGSDVASSTQSGGSNSGGVGSGGTGSYTSGTISGLGSIIVNGVRFDVSQTEVVDDEGVRTHLSDALRLGMTVEVSGSVAVPATTTGGLATASASVVRFASALVGPIDQAPDSSCSCLRVLGQTVTYQATTVMPATLQVGDVIEVHGRADLASRVLVASRIDEVTDGRAYKLQALLPAGRIEDDTRTLSVYGPSQPPTVQGAVPLVLQVPQPALLAPLGEGASTARVVRVWFDADRRLLKVSVDQPLESDRDEARVRGRVTGTRSDAHTVAIDGIWVNVAALDATTVSRLTVGTEVLAEGRLVGGVLQVSEVYLDGDDDDDDAGNGSELELHGAPEATSVTDIGGGQAVMRLRGVTVVFTQAQAPTLARLRAASCVEVHGQGFDAQGRLQATEVKIEDSCH